MKHFLILLITFGLGLAVQCQTPTPAPAQTESILFTNATLHIGNGTKILEGAIGFRDGLIDYVGSTRDARTENYDQVTDVSGKHIYPGFIAPNSTLGLQEIGAVRATRDLRETGEMNPHVRSIIAFNAESEITPTVRTNGVLLGQITPRGRFVAGQSSVVHFDGWNWDDALLKEADGVHIYWPRMYERDHTGKLLSLKERESYTERVKELKSYLDRAKAYGTANDSVIVDLRLDALSRLLNGEMILYVHANSAKEMTAAINLKRDYGIQQMNIVGGREAHLIVNLLKENSIGIMLGRVHALPYYDYSDVDQPYKLPKILDDAGVKWCFENAGDMEQMNTRNLPFYAGTAVAYGLEYEKAVQGLTLNTAELLGVSQNLGSLELGKQATLFISEGDALDMMTNNVTLAFIEGRQIELTNRQIQLYEKYKQKYESSK